MNLYYLTLTLLAIAFSAVGQVFFKYTALRINTSNTHDTTGSPFVLQLLLEHYFWLALVFYGVATLGWVYVLQYVPLSRAYPLMALGYIIIPVCSWLFFQEPMSWRYLGGIFCIIIGIVIIGFE